MLLLKNKFIIFVGFIIIGLIFLIAGSSRSIANDTNSYAVLVKGTGFITRDSIQIDLLNKEQKEILKEGDILKGTTDSSILVLEWGDGSITRLGGKSELVISKAKISKDLSNINISFDLVSGKSWSNVVTFMSEGSFFKESFGGMEASVKGTTFELNLVKDYLYVENHEVDLIDKKTKNKYKLIEGETYSVSLVDFLEGKIKNLGGQVRDIVWSNSNLNLDDEYFVDMKKDIERVIYKNNPYNSLIVFFSNKAAFLQELDKKSPKGPNLESYYSKLSDDDKKNIYDIVFEKYQKLNFSSSEDKELFAKKMLYKEVLMDTSKSEKDKEQHVKYSLYDLKDSILSGDSEGVSEILGFINYNDDYLGGFSNFFDSGSFKFDGKNTDQLKGILKRNYGNLKKIVDFESFDNEDFGIDIVEGVFDKEKNKVENLLKGGKNMFNKFIK